MKCFYHPEVDAVATCVECGKGLCSECAVKYKEMECDDCSVKHKTKIKGASWLEIAICVAVFIATFIYFKYQGSNLEATLVFSWLFCGAPFGWKTLNKITPSVFLFLPIIGWLIFLIFKGILSIVVGIVAMPVSIVMAIVKIVRNK